MPEDHEQQERERKQRIKKLKARTSKMRLAVVSKYKDISKEYEGVGKVAPSRVRNEGEVPKVSLNKSTGKKEAYPLHTNELDEPTDLQKKFKGKKKKGDMMSISLENADKYAAVKKKKKEYNQDAENEHNRDNYNAQSSVETGGDY